MNMDVCQNVSVSVSVSGECQQEQVQVLAPSCSKLSTSSSCLDDLFSAQNTEVDVGLEWLSVFVEDCFSSPPSCVLGPASVHATTTITSKKPSTTLLKKRPQQNNESSLTKFSVPGKARSKRKRLSAPRTTNYRDPLSIWSHNLNLNPSNESLMISDPPLLKQEYWLADSELFVPKQKQNNKDDDSEQQQGVAITKDCEEEEEEGEEEEEEPVLLEKGLVMRKESFGFGFVECENEGSSNNNGQNNNQLVPRRCTHCLAQRTPQWRAGPLGPKTLCNACGVRYKSGRLLPEYRPAKSPTFVSYLHSNSHKKVMEMRMHGSSSILHS